jgi:hypothetical protein
MMQNTHKNEHKCNKTSLHFVYLIFISFYALFMDINIIKNTQNYSKRCLS